MKLIEGKVALVTGASRGIGEGIARKFAEQGADVAITYHSSAERANTLVKELEQQGVRAKAYQSDAASFAAAEQLINDIVSDFGKLDVILNNAGITKDNLLLRMNEQQWDEVINTNLKSMFNIIKNAAKQLLKQRNGSIINVSSIVGIRGNAGQVNYAASKAGIIGLTKSVAQELGSRNIRCNCIAPGFIETDMTEALGEEAKKVFLKEIPLNRLGTTEEVANLAVFLASDLSSYISGQTISICGGLTR